MLRQIGHQWRPAVQETGFALTSLDRTGTIGRTDMAGRKGRGLTWKWFFHLLILLACNALHAQSQGTDTYVYTDPQGTPLAEPDANGNITKTFDYTPYGTTALGTAPNGPGYTGHVNDPETNLVYMQARYYDPATGHFLSVDPAAPTAGNSFNFNRYAYTNNNPILNIDPNGRETGQAYAAIYRADGGVPQTYISPDDKVGPAIAAGLSILPVVGDGVNIGQAFTNPSAVNISAAIIGVIPEIGGPLADAVKGTSGGERAGKAFTQAGKAEVKADNAVAHGGKNVCEACGRDTAPAQQSKAGVTPPEMKRRSITSFRNPKAVTDRLLTGKCFAVTAIYKIG
jgi:RHS repeat-associated protein